MGRFSSSNPIYRKLIPICYQCRRQNPSSDSQSITLQVPGTYIVQVTLMRLHLGVLRFVVICDCFKSIARLDSPVVFANCSIRYELLLAIAAAVMLLGNGGWLNPAPSQSVILSRIAEHGVIDKESYIGCSGVPMPNHSLACTHRKDCG